MAVLSMTGFGRDSASDSSLRAEVEIVSVNRKQFDCVSNLSGALTALEERCKALVHSFISRGRIQLQVRLTEASGRPLSTINIAAAKNRVEELRSLAEQTGISFELSAYDLFRMPDLAASGLSVDPEEAWPAIQSALQSALLRFNEMRKHEGMALRKDLEERLTKMRALRETILQQAPKVPVHYRDMLRERLAALDVTLPVDSDALAREVAIIAERCDIAEELTRLSAHFDHVIEIFDSAEPAGRKLDFLCQEMNREANTIGSKANDSLISSCVIDLKALIETFREQVQNLE